MDNAVIFNNGIFPDFYLTEVAPDYSPGPHTGVLAYLYIANNISSLTDEGGLGYPGRFTVKASDHAYLQIYSILLAQAPGSQSFLVVVYPFMLHFLNGEN